VNYSGNQPELIQCLHENVAVGIAHGYAKASGEPMAVVLHNVVGLLQPAVLDSAVFGSPHGGGAVRRDLVTTPGMSLLAALIYADAGGRGVGHR
jgi:hypothetical protein